MKDPLPLHFPPVRCHAIEIDKDEDKSVTAYYSGPDLSLGPLPALFYFALSGEDSLTLDPFNQPVAALANSDIRVFSLSLPGHEPGRDQNIAIEYWAAQIEQGYEIIELFLERVSHTISTLINQQVIDPSAIGVAGLSRGGFLATHVAARDPRISTVLGYAPMTDLAYHTEFEEMKDHPLMQTLALSNLTDKLTHTHLRYYIGNRDTRVGTRQCFDFIEELTEAFFRSGKRSPPVDLIISPSIGHKGHGTAPTTFVDGARWILSKLSKEGF